MFKLVFLQAASALIGVLIGAAMAGLRGAVSAGLAGLACVLPSLLFAGYLKTSARPAGGVQAIAMLFGEAFKIFLTIAFLMLLPWFYPGLIWGAVVMGLIVTLQSNFLIFLVKH